MIKVPINGSIVKNIVILPDNCPHCHKSITPNVLFGHINGPGLEVFLYCPDKECYKSFIGYYSLNGSSNNASFTNRISYGSMTIRQFSPNVNLVSPQFGIIYNEAYSAEQHNLLEICGVGYRKALEFLIKDYAIQNHPEQKEQIEKKFLSMVIDQYVTDSRIKLVSKRAVWLGNDETHYVRKWEGKNLEDLKKLIDLTLHWIEMEALTKSFHEEMPE